MLLIIIVAMWYHVQRLQGTGFTTDVLPLPLDSYNMVLRMQWSKNPRVGLIEVLNRLLEIYLRCVLGDQPKSWVKLLSLAERLPPLNQTYPHLRLYIIMVLSCTFLVYLEDHKRSK